MKILFSAKMDNQTFCSKTFEEKLTRNILSICIWNKDLKLNGNKKKLALQDVTYKIKEAFQHLIIPRKLCTNSTKKTADQDLRENKQSLTHELVIF